MPYATLEICLAQFWSSLDPSEVEVEIKFHGVVCSISGENQGGQGATSGSGGDLVCVNGSGGFARLDFWCGVRREEIVAEVSLGEDNFATSREVESNKSSGNS